MHPHLPLALALTGLLPAGCSGEPTRGHGHGDTGVEAERSALEHSPPHIDTTTIAVDDPERLGITSNDYYGIPRDSDNDGLFDHVERQHGLDPHNSNSDLDWIGDHWLLLGSRLSPQYYGQTAWFDLGPRAVSVSPPDDEAVSTRPCLASTSAALKAEVWFCSAPTPVARALSMVNVSRFPTGMTRSARTRMVTAS